jgi:uncharacterized membrane protein
MSKDRSNWALLRRYFLTGIVVIAPIGVTLFVLWWIFARLDAILGQIFGALWVRIPGLGLLVLVLLIIGAGWVAHQAVGRELILMGRDWLKKFPLTKTIYTAASQIVEQIVGEDRRFFKQTVLVEYPRPGCWAIGFLTSAAAAEINKITEEDSVAVFLPTTPNPTSGYIVFLPRSQVKPLRMNVEEGFKLVVSGGAVTPEITKQADKDARIG